MDLGKLFACVLLSDSYKYRCAISKMSSLEEVFSTYERELNSIIEKRSDFLQKNISYLEQQDRIEFLTLWDDDYPDRLKIIADPPVVLFYIGKLPSSEVMSVAIVGSRRATIYGKTVALELGRRLSEFRVVVVSGGALGIDTAVHKGCIKQKGIGVAVMGCGLSGFYPKTNTFLFEELIDMGGCVVSEFLPFVVASKYTFPRRNRIISGLSDIVVVVEAAKRSGALITARLALEQGKDVYAVPGQINSALSYGTNKLISEGAYVLKDIDEFLDVIGVNPSMAAKDKILFSQGETDDEVLLLLREIGSVPLDRLIEEMGDSSDKILRHVSLLELEGKIIRDGNIICLR